jgi:hypothetical protein
MFSLSFINSVSFLTVIVINFIFFLLSIYLDRVRPILVAKKISVFSVCSVGQIIGAGILAILILAFLEQANTSRLSQNPKKGLNLKFGRIQDSPLQRVSERR